MAEDSIKVAGYSTILNAALVILKGVLAFLTGSAAVLAEAIHSVADLIGSISVLGGIALSRRTTPSFPWGLYKMEYIAAIVSAFIIFLMAYEIGKEVLFSGAKHIGHINVTILVMLFMTLPVYVFAQFERSTAAESNSPSLLAYAKHWFMDIASIGVVMAGLAGSYFFPYADKIAASIVLVLILKTGFSIINDSMKSSLMPLWMERHLKR